MAQFSQREIVNLSTWITQGLANVGDIEANETAFDVWKSLTKNQQQEIVKRLDASTKLKIRRMEGATKIGLAEIKSTGDIQRANLSGQRQIALGAQRAESEASRQAATTQRVVVGARERTRGKLTEQRFAQRMKEREAGQAIRMQQQPIQEGLRLLSTINPAEPGAVGSIRRVKAEWSGQADQVRTALDDAASGVLATAKEHALRAANPYLQTLDSVAQKAGVLPEQTQRERIVTAAEDIADTTTRRASMERILREEADVLRARGIFMKTRGGPITPEATAKMLAAVPSGGGGGQALLSTAQEAGAAAGRERKLGRGLKAGGAGLAALALVPLLSRAFGGGQDDQQKQAMIQQMLMAQQGGGGADTSKTLIDVNRLLSILKNLQQLSGVAGTGQPQTVASLL